MRRTNEKVLSQRNKLSIHSRNPTRKPSHESESGFFKSVRERDRELFFLLSVRPSIFDAKRGARLRDGERGNKYFLCISLAMAGAELTWASEGAFKQGKHEKDDWKTLALNISTDFNWQKSWIKKIQQNGHPSIVLLLLNSEANVFHLSDNCDGE